MPSNFAKYIYEREGKQIVEDDFGFATYTMNKDYCYIEDIYVIPEMRNCGHATKYAQKIELDAKQKGMKYLTGSVKPSAAGSTASLKVLLAYGFELDCSTQDFIIFKKDLEA